MVIALNGKILEAAKPAGPEYFTYNLYKTLFSDFTNHSYIVYFKNTIEGSLLNKLQSRFPNVKFVQISNNLSWTHLGLSNQLTIDKPNIYFSPEHTLPIKYPKETKLVAMIHGLEIKTNKQLNKYGVHYQLQLTLLKRLCNEASVVIVPSQHTKQQILKEKFLQDDEKIIVINEGVSEAFTTHKNLENIAKIKNEYGIKNEYLLFVSTLQPRKNVDGLVRAYSYAIKMSPSLSNVDLVIAGKKGWGYDSIFETIRAENLDNKVMYIDWVDQEKLPILFSGAKGFVNFSFDEGFSLTLLEAMASGVACAVSDIPAHRELGKDGVVYADPKNKESMANAMVAITDTPSNDLIEKSLTYSKNYSWNKTAAEFIKTFESLL